MRNPKSGPPLKQKIDITTRKITKNKITVVTSLAPKYMFKDYIIQILDRQFPVQTINQFGHIMD